MGFELRDPQERRQPDPKLANLKVTRPPEPIIEEEDDDDADTEER